MVSSWFRHDSARGHDDKPRLFLLKGALVERDGSLTEAHKPTCTEQEIPGYVWQTTPEGRPDKEEPLKLNDHGADCFAMPVCIWTAKRRGAQEAHIMDDDLELSGTNAALQDAALYTTFGTTMKGDHPLIYATEGLSDLFNDLRSRWTQNWCAVSWSIAWLTASSYSAS